MQNYTSVVISNTVVRFTDTLHRTVLVLGPTHASVILRRIYSFILEVILSRTTSYMLAYNAPFHKANYVKMSNMSLSGNCLFENCLMQ